MKISVIIGDDHRMIREGLTALLHRENDIEVVGEANNGADLIQLTRKLQPNVVITDLSMPIMNGLEVISRLCAEPLPSKFLCLSATDQPQKVIAALDAGASGYVLKGNSFEELARAIRRVMANQIFLSGELVGAVMQNYRKPQTPPSDLIILPRLTPREREVAQLISEGYSTQAIADRLFVSIKTIGTHREHIFSKLGIQSVAELTRYMIREELTKPV